MMHKLPSNGLHRAFSNIWRKSRKGGNRAEKVADSLPPLRYQRLPSPTAFRVLDIFPGKTGTAIRCRLRLAEVGDDIYYVALSYTWGNQHPTAKVICDDQVA